MDAHATLQPSIEALVASYEALLTESFSTQEIMAFVLACTKTLVLEAERILQVPGPQKADAVSAAVTAVYQGINPDLPYIPEPFESWLERILLTMVVPAAITVLVGAFNETGLFQYVAPA